jgi:hypothetical protein
MTHLPDAVFIGHEVGHLVEEDFGLDEPLRKAIGTALPPATGPVIEERRSAWMRYWRSEVFADVYGVLVTGSAYAAVLLDLLAGDAAVLAAERQPDDSRPAAQRWSAYPTRTLRARLVCEALRQLPADRKDPDLFVTRATALEASWPKEHAMSAYDDDVKQVVRALLTTPLETFATKASPNGSSLTSVLAFTPGMERTARRDAEQANAKKNPTSSDVRTLFAGVALAFAADTDRYLTTQAQERFRTRLFAIRSEGVRAARRTKAQATARHAAAGKALLARLEALDAAR